MSSKVRPGKRSAVELLKHQAGGVAHLLKNPEAALFMAPGAGKTLTVLATFVELKRRKLLQHLFVVAPTRVALREWPNEVEKWFPGQLTYRVLHGPRKDQVVLEQLPADVYIVNYEALDWFEEFFAAWQRRHPVPTNRLAITWDESTKVKHTSTQRFKIVRRLIPLFGRRTILTGTPAPNGYLDLFGQVFAADGGKRLGRFITQYRRQYFYPSGYGGYTWLLQETGAQRIHAALKDFAYVVGDDQLDLPKKHAVTIVVDLPPKALKQYGYLEREFVLELRGGPVVAKNAGVLGAKLRQLASGFLYNVQNVIDASKELDRHGYVDIHDAKLDALADLVDQLGGAPLLVGFEFRADAERITKRLKLGSPSGLAPVVLGGVTPRVANEMFDCFNQGQFPVLLVQFEAGKFGLNLQDSCHHVAMYGMPWALDTFTQFYRRVWRTGQKHRVTIHHLIARETVDERVYRVVTQVKAPTQQQLINAIAEV